MSAIAHAYYVEDESKVAIAKTHGISRFQVARLLQRAREQGLVRIDIRSADGVNVGLSSELREALGLTAAWVVEPDEEDPVELVGSTMARVLESTVQTGEVIGMNWSRALVTMTRHLTRLPRCTTVQLAGHAAIGTDLPDTSELVRRIARASGGDAFPIPAPLLVTDEAALRSLLGQPAIAAATAMFDSIDTAAISVGAWTAGESTVHASASERDRTQADAHGVVGEVNGRLFDQTGAPVENVIGNRVLGIHLDQLTRVPRLLAGAFGEVRAEATIAAVRAGYVNELVADRALAEAILARY
ncbi:sugar-binding transcriptional regulator [Ruania alba]|nr:sugar-binding domain-containing protein [Ruania alba]